MYLWAESRRTRRPLAGGQLHSHSMMRSGTLFMVLLRQVQGPCILDSLLSPEFTQDGARWCLIWGDIKPFCVSVWFAYCHSLWCYGDSGIQNTCSGRFGIICHFQKSTQAESEYPRPSVSDKRHHKDAPDQALAGALWDIASAMSSGPSTPQHRQQAIKLFLEDGDFSEEEEGDVLYLFTTETVCRYICWYQR